MNHQVVRGPCIVAGNISMFKDVPYYYCALGENINSEYLFKVLGGPEKLAIIKVDEHKTYLDTLEEINSVLADIEKNGVRHLGVSYIERDAK